MRVAASKDRVGRRLVEVAEVAAERQHSQEQQPRERHQGSISAIPLCNDPYNPVPLKRPFEFLYHKSSDGSASQPDLPRLSGVPIIVSVSPQSLMRKRRSLYEAILSLEAEGVEIGRSKDPARSALDPFGSAGSHGLPAREVKDSHASIAGGHDPPPGRPAPGWRLNVSVIGRKMPIADVAITTHTCLCVWNPTTPIGTGRQGPEAAAAGGAETAAGGSFADRLYGELSDALVLLAMSYTQVGGH